MFSSASKLSLEPLDLPVQDICRAPASALSLILSKALSLVPSSLQNKAPSSAHNLKLRKCFTPHPILAQLPVQFPDKPLTSVSSPIPEQCPQLSYLEFTSWTAPSPVPTTKLPAQSPGQIKTNPTQFSVQAFPKLGARSMVSTCLAISQPNHIPVHSSYIDKDSRPPDLSLTPYSQAPKSGGHSELILMT